jgi:hypothetical protein
MEACIELKRAVSWRILKRGRFGCKPEQRIVWIAPTGKKKAIWLARENYAISHSEAQELPQ